MVSQRKKRSYSYPYPRPMVTVDAVIFRQTPKRLELLVIRRKNPPFAGMLAFPGGFVDMDEDLKDAAGRELFEETGLNGVTLHQIGAFGKPGRDPRGRNICVAFAGVLGDLSRVVKGGDDAAEALWISARRAPQLGFDHNDILRSALRWLKKTAI